MKEKSKKPKRVVKKKVEPAKVSVEGDVIKRTKDAEDQPGKVCNIT